jgi:glycosyltransferase involved in cell wall biosynthesis
MKAVAEESRVRAIKVLQVCTILLTARTFIAPVALYLRARGYDVAVACSGDEAADGPGLSANREVAGCTLYFVTIPRTIRPFQDLRAVCQLYRLMRRLRPDIVHTQTSKAGIVGRLAAWLAGTPVIIHSAHAFPFHPYLPGPARWMYIAIERWAARLADLIMVDTESVRTDGLQYRIVQDPTKLVTVPMGIDLKKFSPSSQGPDNLRRALGFDAKDLVVGTVARLVPDKGLECFLRMAARVLAARSDVRFLIVGDGPLRPELERLADELGIRAKVIFTGHRTDVPALMKAMDLFVLPTLREGFGVVFAEAMATGKATIGSRIGPVAEIVEDGVTGYLVPPDDPEQFAQRVLELLGDDGKRRAFGEAGRRRVEKLFTEERMCETIERQYRRLLESKGLLT